MAIKLGAIDRHAANICCIYTTTNYSGTTSLEGATIFHHRGVDNLWITTLNPALFTPKKTNFFCYLGQHFYYLSI